MAGTRREENLYFLVNEYDMTYHFSRFELSNSFLSVK